ncbi:MAG: hypothetical protein R2715_15990 [Ilumatobacteraceae bacterium]
MGEASESFEAVDTDPLRWRSSTGRTGTQWRMATAMSWSGSAGAAKSKSKIPVARPSCTATFSTHQSL